LNCDRLPETTRLPFCRSSVFVFLFLLANTKPIPASASITFSGFTNAAARRFALFTIDNHDHVPLRWRGSAFGVEDDQMEKATVTTPSLVQFKSPTLDGGQSLIIVVGDPMEGEN
jgi:hypothetical protein